MKGFEDILNWGWGSDKQAPPAQCCYCTSAKCKHEMAKCPAATHYKVTVDGSTFTACGDCIGKLAPLDTIEVLR